MQIIAFILSGVLILILGIFMGLHIAYECFWLNKGIRHKGEIWRLKDEPEKE